MCCLQTTIPLSVRLLHSQLWQLISGDIASSSESEEQQ